MSKEKQNNELVQMYRDLGEIFDEEYEKRRLITPQNTAEKMTAKGYRKQEWISVDERLPEQWQRVLVNYNGNVCISWKNVNSTWFECQNDKVTHWMPLPEAPKMKGGAE